MLTRFNHTGTTERSRSVKQVRRYPGGQDGSARETEAEVNNEYEMGV